MKNNLFALGFFSFLTIIVSWPLILHLDSLIIDKYDGLLITWILNWDIHSLTSGLTGLVNFYNANIFYPDKNTLAFSDLQLPLATIALPFVLITREPLVAYNINFLLGFILTAFSVYLLAGSGRVGLISGLVFTFSTIHLNYMTHLQLFNFWPVVLAIYFLLKKKWRWYILFFVTAGLVTPLNVFFLAVVALFRRGLRATAVGLVILAPFLFPYFLVSRQYHYVRPITDAIHFSLFWGDLFTRGSQGYLGTVFLALVVVAIWKRRRDFWFWLAVISLVMALGPALHLIPTTVHIGPLRAIPLPYAIFYYLVPGFSGFRTPSRWILLMALGLVIFSTRILKNKPVWILAAIGFLVILEINYPFKFYQVPPREKFPAVQQWLVTNYVGASIAQFPIYGWWDPSTTLRAGNPVDGLGLETLREYYSTIHWHPMYNGYSGFSPKEWEDSVKWLQKNCPSENCLRFLKTKGIKLVIDDQKRIWPAKLIKQFASGSIYEIE